MILRDRAAASLPAVNNPVKPPLERRRSAVFDREASAAQSDPMNTNRNAAASAVARAKRPFGDGRRSCYATAGMRAARREIAPDLAAGRVAPLGRHRGKTIR
jgi:hypothetical protein